MNLPTPLAACTSPSSRPVRVYGAHTTKNRLRKNIGTDPVTLFPRATLVYCQLDIFSKLVLSSRAGGGYDLKQSSSVARLSRTIIEKIITLTHLCCDSCSISIRTHDDVRPRTAKLLNQLYILA